MPPIDNSNLKLTTPRPVEGSTPADVVEERREVVVETEPLVEPSFTAEVEESAKVGRNDNVLHERREIGGSTVLGSRLAERQPLVGGSERLFDARTNPSVQRAAEVVFAELAALPGGVPEPGGVEPLRLGRGDRKALVALAAALHQARESLPPDRLEALAEALHGEWLATGDLTGITRRVRIAAKTGYLLMDTGPDPNPRDTRGWSGREIEQMEELLGHLPPLLLRLPTLLYVTRDTRSTSADELIEEARHEGPLPMRAVGLLMRGLNIGAEFGHAIRFDREIRLYNELFAGSRLPGLKRMVAYTTIHEICHHLLFSSPEIDGRPLRRTFTDFYRHGGGREDSPYAYARGSIDEGFAVNAAMYAVAPQLLAEKSPKYHAFFAELFGDSLTPFEGRGLEAKAIDLVYSSSRGA